MNLSVNRSIISWQTARPERAEKKSVPYLLKTEHAVIGKLCQSRRHRCPIDPGQTKTHQGRRSLEQIAPFRQAAIDISAMPHASETPSASRGRFAEGNDRVWSPLYLFVLAHDLVPKGLHLLGILI